MDANKNDKTPVAQNPATFFNAASVVPDDAQDLPAVSRALFIGTHGQMTVIMANDEKVEFVNLGQGQLWPIGAKRVLKTGTTASAIVALW